MPGAPTTSIAAIDAPFMGRKMGLGFTLVHDQIGISRDIGNPRVMIRHMMTV